MLSGVVFDLLGSIFSLLPSMPFDLNDLNILAGNEIVVTVLSWFNYFVPVQAMAAILALWSVAMMSYVGLKLAIKYSEGLR